ncbi:MAG: sodium-translocating pyrophosphatase [Oscillospiraceae bacterium]|jgi:K(+)-stimulated pyrophosphate-energized sodium pump|nr:sodium-translocating pyrophosphatase [Oscillospiraceae bacterium]
MIYTVGLGVVMSLLFAYANYRKVASMSAGTPQMQEIAQAIKEGADAFLSREFAIDIPIIVLISVLFGVFFTPWAGLSLLIGAAMSSLAGLCGMKAAVIANVRVTNAAREGVERKDETALGKALQVAFQGGAVMGLSVGGFALLGLLIVYLLAGFWQAFANPVNLVPIKNWLGVEMTVFTQVITCYSLGCSTVALFNRLGGGIYTKGADMGADLVGKSELGIPEDDPRNPAVIADCVGDNVGDVAGNGSDLLESTIGSISAATVLPTTMYTVLKNSSNPETARISDELLTRMMQFPLTVVGLGLIACIIGIAYVIYKKASNHPSHELNLSLWSSAAMIGLGSLVLSLIFFRGQDTAPAQFRFGWVSPWLAAIIGVVAGITLGMLAERYTSERYKETQDIAELAKKGTALLITGGMSSGWRSCLPACLVLGGAVILASFFCGSYGSPIAAVGMLSFVAATVTVDTYGPISDNAGGIAEMSKQDPRVREITDSLDSQGNTTAAIGKGYAIGSGVLAALSLMLSFSESIGQQGESMTITNFLLIGGAFVGVGLMHWLSGQMLLAVTRNADHMVEEVRRQFREIKGLMEGSAKPDYAQCVRIATNSALREMVKPCIVALATPIIGGFLLGPLFVGGLLLGTILDSVTMATSTANSGGAWDNAKKYIKSMETELTAQYGAARYKDIHDAAVNGDTVGDGFKDVVGPNQDIMIKLMSTMALIWAPVFAAVNLFSLIAK